MKRYAVLGIIIALVVSIANIGCSSGSNKPHSTPTKTPAHTAAPTAEPTEEPEEAGELPANYKFFVEWSTSEDVAGESQYWFKGDKWRQDSSVTQEETETESVIMYDGQFFYMYYPDMEMVIKYSDSSGMTDFGAAYAQEFEDGYWGEVSDTTILTGFQAACSGTAYIDGQEDVSGISCTKFTCDFADGMVSHYWIADSGWLIKGEVISAEGYTYTMQYSNIELNADISDSIFDIDSIAPGVPVTEL